MHASMLDAAQQLDLLIIGFAPDSRFAGVARDVC